jgi:type IV secretory pathway VirB9-like protein
MFDMAGAEEAYAAGQTTAQSHFFNPQLKQAMLYIYNLENMKQVNTAMGFVRDVKRTT